MANPKHLAILKHGVDVWNEWREENPDVVPNLRRANLWGVNLSEANLSEADLPSASLWRASLWRAGLWRAGLSSADLSKTDLSKADLSSADLSSAGLRESNLGGTQFSNLDLSKAIGLETCIHNGSSTIGTDTLLKSKGRIPIEFLRGCGLADWEIESTKLYQPNLSNQEIIDINYRIIDIRMTQAIQINPLFISYSHADAAFVDRIGEALTEKGVRYWRDIHDAKAGKLEKQVDRAMRLNPIVLIVLSKASTNSDWVEYEAGKARKLEKESTAMSSAPSPSMIAGKTATGPAASATRLKTMLSWIFRSGRILRRLRRCSGSCWGDWICFIRSNWECYG